jgi:hypothetical protein
MSDGAETTSGEALVASGRFEEAERLFLQALRASPENAEVLNNLGVLAHRKGATTEAIDYLTRAVSVDPRHRDAIFNLAQILRKLNLLHEMTPLLEAVGKELPEDLDLNGLLAEARTFRPPLPDRRPRGRLLPWKLCYSPGVARHGESLRKMLDLSHYIPSLHHADPVWFFGLYFDGDYHQLLAHGGKKIINWRGSDSLRLRESQERIRIIQHTRALHVCQSSRQEDVLREIGIPSLVRPMFNSPVDGVSVSEFPSGPTAILVLWRRGIDGFIQADMFFEIAARCRDVTFHIVGDEDSSRFSRRGMENLVFHGFVSEQELDAIMDACKGTIRPWISDGTPNVQTRMLLKGRYAAHSCRFEKVAQCITADDYVGWIEALKEIREPNLEARDWWIENLNRFDFLEADFEPAPWMGLGSR